MRYPLTPHLVRRGALAVLIGALAACKPAGQGAPSADAVTAPMASGAVASIAVPLNLATDSGTGTALGQVDISETPYGLVFTPDLSGLPPGLHGFHVHENASCDPNEKDGKPVPAGAAGGHYDPARTTVHGAPWGTGHAGDLPPLYVDAEGKAGQPVLAPRLKLAEVKGHALMVHAGGDNHADHPEPLGGGGARVACGVIP